MLDYAVYSNQLRGRLILCIGMLLVLLLFTTVMVFANKKGLFAKEKKIVRIVIQVIVAAIILAGTIAMGLSTFEYASDIKNTSYVEYEGTFVIDESKPNGFFVIIQDGEKTIQLESWAAARDGMKEDTVYYGKLVYAVKSKTLLQIIDWYAVT